MALTRRQALAGAAVATMRAPHPATGMIWNAADDPAPRRVTVGANASFARAVQHVIPQARAVRSYRGAVNDIPGRWPVTRFIDGTRADTLLSIRPLPSDLLAGRLDGTIRGLVESAPRGAMLNVWHEAGNLPAYKLLTFLDPATVRAVHRRMKRLCAGTHVAYGPILCLTPNLMHKWVEPDIDWCGLDIYDWPQFHFGGNRDRALDIHGRLAERLDGWHRVISQVTGRANPRLLIAETNARRGARAKWFEALGGWLSRHNGSHLFTFWSDLPDDGTGGWPWAAPGPWPVRGQPDVIAALSRVAAAG